MSPSRLRFGEVDICRTCKSIDRSRKPYGRGWVWRTADTLRDNDVILEKIEPRKRGAQTWYRVQCPTCHGEGFTTRTPVAERVGE